MIFYGLPDKSTEAVVTAIKWYQAGNIVADTYGCTDLKHIRSDTSSQFTSGDLADYCTDKGI
jgi:hypothetical protein